MGSGVRRWLETRHWSQMLRSGLGFTIIETLIVLAVTGVLFTVIAVTLTGRQNSAQFNNAVQTIQSEIQQTIDQVAQGFYPNNNDFMCSNGGSGNTQISPGTNTQGTNQDCVFLGKVIQFDVQGNGLNEQYQVYSIAGLNAPTPQGATSPFINNDPVVIGLPGQYPNFSQAGSLRYGLSTVWARSDNNIGCSAPACSIGAVGFLMEPGSAAVGSTSGYSSGSQLVDLVPLTGTFLNKTIPQGVSEINNVLSDNTLTADAPINPTSGVQICFKSSGTNQSGLITIGGNGRQLLVNLQVKGNLSCS